MIFGIDPAPSKNTVVWSDDGLKPPVAAEVQAELADELPREQQLARDREHPTRERGS